MLEIEVTLEQCYNGTTITKAYPKLLLCTECKG